MKIYHVIHSHYRGVVCIHHLHQNRIYLITAMTSSTTTTGIGVQYPLRNSTLTVLVGGMGSGKTTETIRLAVLASFRQAVLCVVHSGSIMHNDPRDASPSPEIMYPETEQHHQQRLSRGYIETHDGGRLSAIHCTQLGSLFGTAEYAAAEHIFVDEGQFFNDLVPFIEIARGMHAKDITVNALDGTHDMHAFVDLNYLVPHATKFKKLVGVCAYCNETAPYTRKPQQQAHVLAFDADACPPTYESAQFMTTSTLGLNNVDKAPQQPEQHHNAKYVDVGGFEKYAPVCYQHAVMKENDLPPRKDRRRIL
jgi:thymidine kinase